MRMQFAVRMAVRTSARASSVSSDPVHTRHRLLSWYGTIIVHVVGPYDTLCTLCTCNIAIIVSAIMTVNCNAVQHESATVFDFECIRARSTY